MRAEGSSIIAPCNSNSSSSNMAVSVANLQKEIWLFG